MTFDTFLEMNKNSDDLISKDEMIQHIKEMLEMNGSMPSQGLK